MTAAETVDRAVEAAGVETGGDVDKVIALIEGANARRGVGVEEGWRSSLFLSAEALFRRGICPVCLLQNAYGKPVIGDLDCGGEHLA